VCVRVCVCFEGRVGVSSIAGGTVRSLGVLWVVFAPAQRTCFLSRAPPPPSRTPDPRTSGASQIGPGYTVPSGTKEKQETYVSNDVPPASGADTSGWA